MCKIAREALNEPALPHWSWGQIVALIIAGGTFWYLVLSALAG